MCSLVGVDLDYADATFLPRCVCDLFLGWAGLLHVRHLQQQALYPYRYHCGHVYQLFCAPGRGVLVRWRTLRILEDARNKGNRNQHVTVILQLNLLPPIVVGASTGGNA